MEEKRISSHRRELRDFGGRHCLYRQQRRRRGSQVSGMAQRPADIRGFIGSAAARAVRVLNNDSETVLDVYINLKQGARIPDVAGKYSAASRWLYNP